jgi:hypothetical protein
LKTAEEEEAAMSSMEMDLPDGQSADPEAAVGPKPHVSFWVRELPFSLVLILTLLGVAYTSLLKQPIMVYWELLAPVIGLVCVSSGWSRAIGRTARMILLPSVGEILNANATGLSVLMLLALGTFTAGVHVLSWQICLLGIIMAFCVPAAAWIEASALIVALITIAVFGIGFMLWWFWHKSRARILSID